MLNNIFSENRAVYEKRWKNMAQPDRSQITIWHMRFASWITKTTDKNSEYVILTAFPRQQWLHEHVCVTSYVTCLSCVFFIVGIK